MSAEFLCAADSCELQSKQALLELTCVTVSFQLLHEGRVVVTHVSEVPCVVVLNL